MTLVDTIEGHDAGEAFQGEEHASSCPPHSQLVSVGENPNPGGESGSVDP
jgi:hypothetical protein